MDRSAFSVKGNVRLDLTLRQPLNPGRPEENKRLYHPYPFSNTRFLRFHEYNFAKMGI